MGLEPRELLVAFLPPPGWTQPGRDKHGGEPKRDIFQEEHPKLARRKPHSIGKEVSGLGLRHEEREANDAVEAEVPFEVDANPGSAVRGRKSEVV